MNMRMVSLSSLLLVAGFVSCNASAISIEAKLRENLNGCFKRLREEQEKFFTQEEIAAYNQLVTDYHIAEFHEDQAKIKCTEKNNCDDILGEYKAALDKANKLGQELEEMNKKENYKAFVDRMEALEQEQRELMPTIVAKMEAAAEQLQQMIRQ